MIAQECIQTIDPIQTTADRKACIELLQDLKCFELPVLKDGKLIGKIELDELLFSEDETIENLISDGFASAYFNTHIFDVLRIFKEGNSDSCAVLGAEFEFLGVVTKLAALDSLSDSLSVEQQGAIVMIEMATSQYSSSEISRIVESENAQLLGFWLENVPDSGRIRASLKLNTKNAERIIASLSRFNYEVIASFGDDDYKENVEQRYQSLMKYLDI